MSENRPRSLPKLFSKTYPNTSQTPPQNPPKTYQKPPPNLQESKFWGGSCRGVESMGMVKTCQLLHPETLKIKLQKTLI